MAVLASLSSTTERAKVILTAALEAGVVDAFVGTLRHSLRHPNPDRVVRAMLYKVCACVRACGRARVWDRVGWLGCMCGVLEGCS